MSINLDFSEGGRYFIHVDEDTLSVFVSWTLSNDVIGMDDEFQYIHYTFPRKNRLANVRLNPDNPGDTNVSYGYLPNGDRISRANDTETIYYLHDRDNVIAVLDTSGNPIETFLHGKGVDEPVAMSYSKGTHAFVQDGLGSTVSLVDVLGQSVPVPYVYDAWGNLEACYGDQTMNNPYLFTGREYDWQTGVYYYRARSYDANLGRFLQPDPAGMVDGPNMYAYCGGDPVNNKDPGGTVTFSWIKMGFRQIKVGFKIQFSAYETGLIAAGLGIAAMIAGVVPFGQPAALALGISAIALGVCNTLGRGLTLYRLFFVTTYWCEGDTSSSKLRIGPLPRPISSFPINPHLQGAMPQ